MATFKISGVWKNDDGIITDYAFHTVNGNSITRATKKSKAEAIKLLQVNGNSAETCTWDYKKAGWKIGEEVNVVGSGSNKYLRSNPDNTTTDNLGHLIDFDWVKK